MQELDETAYWLEVLEETGIADADALLAEAEELIAIMVTIAKKAKHVSP